MKPTGIIRRVDDLGRIAIPKAIRREMRIREGDPVEVVIRSDDIVCFKRYDQFRSPRNLLSELREQIADANIGHKKHSEIGEHINAIANILSQAEKEQNENI